MAKILTVVIIIGLLLLMLVNPFQNPSGRGPQANLAFSDFLAEVDNGRVRDVTIQGSTITGHFSDGRSFATFAPEDPSLVSRLTERGVRITAAPVDDSLRSPPGVIVSVMLCLVAGLLMLVHGLRSELHITTDRLCARIDRLERGLQAFEDGPAPGAPSPLPKKDNLS